MTAGDERAAQAPDPLYVVARRVLLDALDALSPHAGAVIVAGAQAVYLRTGDADLAVAPHTTDGDLALDPRLLADDPALGAAMAAAGFIADRRRGHVEPGVWLASAEVGGTDIVVPVDLIVPAGATNNPTRRGARLGPHGREAARIARGLEAALVDHSRMTIAALDPGDSRTAAVKVAGPAALLVAKLHKLHDRVADTRRARVDDKDAADVLRLMQTHRPALIAETLARLEADPVAADATTEALAYVDELFGRRGREGVVMASRALRLAMPAERVEALCVSFTQRLLAAFAS